jgi:hypothetical protein
MVIYESASGPSGSSLTASSGFHHHSAFMVCSKVSAMHRQPIVTFSDERSAASHLARVFLDSLKSEHLHICGQGRCEPITDLRNP